MLGKPAQAFFDAALARLGVSAEQTAMVGDDIRADIGGAQAAGLGGILVRTGKFRPGDLGGEIALSSRSRHCLRLGGSESRV